MNRDLVYLLDILQATSFRILQDTQRQDSVIRRIEIIGEAARRISPQTRTAYPDIPWNAMIGRRS